MSTQPVFPIFVFAEDDPTDLCMHDDAFTAGHWYEAIDIEAGLYSGWDLEGRPLKLVLDQGSKAVLVDTKPRPDELRAAILRFANSCGSEAPFVCPENADGVVSLYLAAKEHCEAIRAECWNRTWWGKIMRMLRRR